jgi:hypothetical protein
MGHGMYAKLFTSIYQGTLRGNAHGLLVFTNLLAHCDKTGEVDMHPRAIAEEVGLTVDQVRVALAMLEAPDNESRSPELEGRRIVRLDEHRDWGWRVVNFLKYRSIRDADDRREQNRIAQETWRKKNKPASAEPKPDKPIQKQKQIQEDISLPAVAHHAKRGTDDGFEAFWEVCPRKIGKGAARKAWVKIAPTAELQKAMISAMQQQATWDGWTKDSGKYIPHPSTWLAAERWSDVDPSLEQATKRTQRQPSDWDRYQEEQRTHVPLDREAAAKAAALAKSAIRRVV